jgi:trimeric autotransporter adhesin
MQILLSLRRILAGLCGLVTLALAAHPLTSQTTGPQQLIFAGLLGSTNPNPAYPANAQFNAVQSDASGNIYLLLDQKDGVRLLKTDPTATNVLAQTQLGAAGDIAVAMALDPSGNIYITGTTTSGAITATSGAAFRGPTGTSTNGFIGKFDQNLNPIFITYAGSGGLSVTAIAATADAVFITGSIFGSTLPVTPSAIIQSPAAGSLQNGFVERFNASGTTLVYATYLSGQNGNTVPAAIAADTSNNAYIAGYTTSSGYPTLNAFVPDILSPTSGFLTKLTPAADGLLFSTFIPGPGITSIAIDPAAQNLLLSGAIALGQFPIETVSAPLVNTTYQTLLRLSFDGSAVISSTLLAPGTQSTLTTAPNQNTWIATTLTDPAWLLPLAPLSTIGNSYALHINQQNQIDQTIRFGGLPTTNPTFASAPVTLTSVTTGPNGQPIFAGSAGPTASASLVATETYDLPLYNTPTSALSSNLRAAVLSPADCSGSLCSGAAAYLAKLSPTPAPALALSVDASPNITLRNLGSVTATNLQLTATNFTLASNCPATFAPGAECSIALTSTATDPGTLTAQAANATTQTATLPATTTRPNPIAFSPKELDFGIETSTSPAAIRTITVTNLTQQPQTFTSKPGSNQLTPYIFAESFSDCPLTAINTKTIAAGATCHITLSFTASSTPADDGFALSNWTIGPGSVLLTGYTQAVALSLSVTEIDFGTQFGTTPAAGPRLPRFLYISNNSATPVPHTPVSLASPFTLTDHCPTTLEPHTVCQIEITYQSPVAPSADSTTLTLDQGQTLLITGSTLPQPTGIGQSVNPNLTVTPATITFPTPVQVTSTSTTPLTVTIGNTGAQPFNLALALTGDFTSSTDCTSTLAANSTCTVLITFAPSQPGTRQGLLSITAGSGTSPAYVALNGTGSSILTTPNNTLEFGNVLVGQPAVKWYKITSPFATLTATSSTPDYKAVLIEDIGYGHGDPPTSAFATTFTGPCTNCWLGVQFTPSTIGPETATLTLASNTSGTPAPFTLTGTGQALTGLVLTPITQDFGPVPVHSTSAPILFTLTNLTAAPVSLSTPTTTGDFSIANAPTGGPACNGPVAPNESCFVNVIFSPTNTGPLTGVLTVPTTNFPANATLSGFGNPDPGLALDPNSLIFNNVPGKTASQQTIALTNTGSVTLQIAGPTTATTDFAEATTCTTLAPAATCTITITYVPTAALTTDTLQIPVTSSLTGLTTYTVPLTGNYTTEDSSLQVLPNEASYGPTPTETLGGTRQFTINNLTAKSLTLDVALPRQFVLSGPPCAALAPNASCQFAVTFLPLTNGDITGTLFTQATPTDGSATLNGLGYVEGYGTGSSALTIAGNLVPGQSMLNFGQVSSGQSKTQTLTLMNNATAPLTVRRITSEWPFLVTVTTCGATLSTTQSCTVTLSYTPLNQTAPGSPASPATTNTGTLVIESDALTGPDYIDLTGTVAPVSVATPSNTAPLVSYTASQSSLTFATTQVGNAAQPQTIVLANTGTVPIHITSLQTTPDFAVRSNCATVLPSASCIVIVTFTPQPATDPTDTTRISALEITSDASTALDFISLLGTATPSPLTIAPIALDFGSVQLGATSTLPLQITNTSTTPATFNSISTTGDYTATGTCPTAGDSLAPATTCTEQITFTPTQTSTRAGTVSIATSLSTLPINAPLTGIGIQSHLQITPSALDFASIAIGASANLTLTLANSGSAPVTNLSVNLTGDYALTVPCTATILAANATCNATITFTPTALGQRAGTLTIASSDPNSPTLVPLTGTGVPNGSFLLTVNGGATASATVASEAPATYNLQLTPQNNYSGDVVLNCTAIAPGQYATCSLLPSSITLSGASQNAVATINTITTVNLSATAQNTHTRLNKILLCLLPTSLFFFWSTLHRKQTCRTRNLFCVLLLTLTTLWPSGCGSGGDPNIRTTPPGAYQYQVTASSTAGVQLIQTVTLNLTVTAR